MHPVAEEANRDEDSKEAIASAQRSQGTPLQQFGNSSVSSDFDQLSSA
jgi:hypothetical protein